MLALPLERPVGVIFLHGQLAPVAWAFGQATPRAALGYVQTAGGALPGALSRTVGELRGRGLLAGHLTAGPGVRRRRGGDHDRRRDPPRRSPSSAGTPRCAGRGPGILGSASRARPRRHGRARHRPRRARARLPDRRGPAHVVRRPARRHRGLSHHTATVLALLLGAGRRGRPRARGRRRTRPTSATTGARAAADLEGYRASGLPARTMGRGLERGRAVLRGRAGRGTACWPRWSPT